MKNFKQTRLKKLIYRFAILFLNIFLAIGLSAQEPAAIEYLSIETTQGLTKLRIISVADAIAAGHGVLKIALNYGSEGAADLVPVDHIHASPVRINTTYGIKAWRFESNDPCDGLTSINYEGQDYNIVAIGNQCWMAENLNVGILSDFPLNNGIIEKWCYNNADSCEIYGGLYSWDEMMQYDTVEGSQGICPPGWYIPTDNDFQILEGTVDSQYGVGDPVWENGGVRGFDAGLNIKATNKWINNGNGNDSFDFTFLPGGWRHPLCNSIGGYGYLWTSSQTITLGAFFRSCSSNANGIIKSGTETFDGLSVRCIKD